MTRTIYPTYRGGGGAQGVMLWARKPNLSGGDNPAKEAVNAFTAVMTRVIDEDSNQDIPQDARGAHYALWFEGDSLRAKLQKTSRDYGPIPISIRPQANRKAYPSAEQSVVTSELLITRTLR